jgi:hypothetical protein
VPTTPVEKPKPKSNCEVSQLSGFSILSDGTCGQAFLEQFDNKKVIIFKREIARSIDLSSPLFKERLSFLKFDEKSQNFSETYVSRSVSRRTVPTGKAPDPKTCILEMINIQLKVLAEISFRYILGRHRQFIFNYKFK